jgi:hypothetical protein
VSASVSFAQQSDSTLSGRPAARPGRGAVGGEIGGSWILAGDDYAKHAQPRLSFLGSFRYVISPHWRWQVSPYFTWAAYRTGTPLPFVDGRFPEDTTRDNVLTQVAGGNGQLQLMGGSKKWIWHLGGGPALYRVVVQNRRRVLMDPHTERLHQGTYLGATAEWGIEHFLGSLPNTSLEWTVAYQSAFARRDAQFIEGFNGTPQAVEFRFGGHYYYDFKADKKTGSTSLPRH